MKAIELKDILSYRFLSNIRYAPGGERAAFVAASASEEDNSYEQRLWLYEQGQVRQLTDLGKEGRFTWLDENRLLFPAVRSAKEKKRAEGHEEFTSYYVLDLRGGEALPFMTLPFAAGNLRVLDENHFAVSATVDKLHPELYAAEEEERPSCASSGRRTRTTRSLTSCPGTLTAPASPTASGNASSWWSGSP